MEVIDIKEIYYKKIKTIKNAFNRNEAFNYCTNSYLCNDFYTKKYLSCQTGICIQNNLMVSSRKTGCRFRSSGLYRWKDIQLYSTFFLEMWRYSNLSSSCLEQTYLILWRWLSLWENKNRNTTKFQEKIQWRKGSSSSNCFWTRKTHFLRLQLARLR